MRILFISSGSIGDAIISTGLIGYLADAYPQARFTIAAGPASVPLFAAFPQLERLIVMRKRKYNLHWLMLLKQVWRSRWDLVVDLRGSLTAYLLHTHSRKIFRKPDRMLSKARQLAALFDLSTTPPTRLWSSKADKERAAELLPNKPVIILAPKTNSEAKDWPIERFAELALRLCKQDITFAVMASAAQKESVQPLVKALPLSQVVDLSGKTDLLTAYAIMEGARLFIGNDSGLLHMAAAAGTPCVGIYGPSNDKVYAPQGLHVRIVKSYDFAMGEEEKRDNRYMQMISVDAVEEAVKSLESGI